MKKNSSLPRRTGDQSRKSILDAAGVVFAERGFDKATIREVAQRAGISIGGIYLYFRNKEELYTGLMQEQIERFSNHIRVADALPPIDALAHIFGCYIEFAVKRTKMLSTNIKEHDLALKKPIRKAFFFYQRRQIADILRRGVREGIFRKVNPEETADVIISCLRGAMLSYLSGEVRALKKHGDSIYTIILNGIRSDNDA